MTRHTSRLDDLRGDIPGVDWPPLFSTRSATLAATVEGFERAQWLPRKAIEAGQRRQLLALGKHYAEHSAWFRARLDAAGLSVEEFAAPGGLARLPPIERREAQTLFAEPHVTALPPGHGELQRHNTSGSTGEPVLVWKTAVNRAHWLALSLRYFLWQEPDFSARLAVIRANLQQFGEALDWGPPVSPLFDSGPLLRIDIEDDIDRQIEQIRAFKPRSLVIYPSNLAAMLDVLERTRRKLPSVKNIRTIGETLSAELRARAETQLRARVMDCYSIEEAGYVSIECPEAGNHHVMSETVIVEIVDEAGNPCRTGQTGRVLVTDLHNFATPLIRYAVGDYAQWGAACRCGRGLPVIKRIVGRERNMIVKPDGTRHWPLTGYKKFREIAPILQYQFVQHAPDRIEIRLVTERPLTAAEEAALTKHLHWKLRHRFRFDYRYFEGRLPPGKNGKFEEFVSLIGHAHD